MEISRKGGDARALACIVSTARLAMSTTQLMILVLAFCRPEIDFLSWDDHNETIRCDQISM
jgi:hypothetical protein